MHDPWTAAMRRGDFEAAWAVSDAVLARRLASGDRGQNGPRHEQAVWNGEPFDGRRVLVRCYHGLGDTLQFIRYAAPLRARAAEVLVWAQPALMELVAGVPGVDRVLPLHDGVPDISYDLDVEIMELPHALRVPPSALPLLPYLRAGMEPPAGPRPAVGIVWEGGGWDGRRNAPLALVERLAAVPGVTLVSLQRGPAAEGARALGLADGGDDDVGRLARRMRGLDRVISVDTMTAHLAGALGVPCWTLLHAEPDWRWLGGGEATPWYPGMRLFRQPAPGDWGAVAAEVAEALSRLAGGETKVLSPRAESN